MQKNKQFYMKFGLESLRSGEVKRFCKVSFTAFGMWGCKYVEKKDKYPNALM